MKFVVTKQNWYYVRLCTWFCGKFRKQNLHQCRKLAFRQWHLHSYLTRISEFFLSFFHSSFLPLIADVGFVCYKSAVARIYVLLTKRTVYDLFSISRVPFRLVPGSFSVLGKQLFCYLICATVYEKKWTCSHAIIIMLIRLLRLWGIFSFLSATMAIKLMTICLNGSNRLYQWIFSLFIVLRGSLCF